MTNQINQLAMEYAIKARRPADVNTVQRFYEQNQRYMKMVKEVGLKATDTAIAEAHQILKITEG
jgi:hypothetical protein